MDQGEQKAQDTIDFIRSLRHVKDPWHGRFFTLLDWQERILRDVYGTLKADGTRQIKHVYLEIPKKQGKSELVAAIAIKQLCADGEHFAEVYGCAADKAQASIIYDVAVAMIEQEPELLDVCRIVPSKKRIVYLPTKSFYQVLSSEAYTKHGLNVSAVVFDEIHAQPNRGLYDVMTFGSGDARVQPIYWYITTAGDDPDRTSIGWEVHKKAVDVLLGNRIDPTWYPVIWGHDPEERRIWKGWDFETYGEGAVSWESDDLWRKVNPSLDHTVKMDTLREAYVTVKDNPPEERLFRQLRTNEWVKSRAEKWMPQERWDGSAGDVPAKDLWEQLRGRECFGGLDLSSKVDMTAFVLVFPPAGDDPRWHVLPSFWLPEDNMRERVKTDGVPYDLWAAQGYIHLTPGNVIDYAFIRQVVTSLRDRYFIREIGYDPWNAMQLALDLTDDGFECFEVRQGFKTMSEPMKTINAEVRAGRFVHGAHPVLRWNAGNVEAKMDENENIRPIKDKSTGRIDGIVAAINAMDRALRHPANAATQVFVI